MWCEPGRMRAWYWRKNTSVLLFVVTNMQSVVSSPGYKRKLSTSA